MMNRETKLNQTASKLRSITSKFLSLLLIGTAIFTGERANSALPSSDTVLETTKLKISKVAAARGYSLSEDSVRIHRLQLVESAKFLLNKSLGIAVEENPPKLFYVEFVLLDPNGVLLPGKTYLIVSDKNRDCESEPSSCSNLSRGFAMWNQVKPNVYDFLSEANHRR